MRIAINAIRVSGHGESGFDAYIVNIINALSAVSADFDVYTLHPEHFGEVPENRRIRIRLPFYRALVSTGPREEGQRPRPGSGPTRLALKRAARVVLRRVSRIVNIDSVSMFWTQCIFPFRVFANQYDLVVSMTQLEALMFCPARQVSIVYDLIPLFFPADRHQHKLFLRVCLPRILRRASRTVAISGNTRGDLVRCYGLDPSRVDTVPAAVRWRFEEVDAKERGQFRARHGLDRYVLCVGGNGLHKNLDILIAAYRLFRERAGREDLVVIGAFTPKRLADLRALVERLRLTQSVKFLGHISERELRIAYSCAEVFVCPSLYEGFGIPPLEAMSCGCPVVVSRAASLPEVVGDAGVYVDPQDAESIADGVFQVLNSTSMREKLVAAGFQRVTAFSWQRSAALLNETMARALQGQRGTLLDPSGRTRGTGDVPQGTTTGRDRSSVAPSEVIDSRGRDR